MWKWVLWGQEALHTVLRDAFCIMRQKKICVLCTAECVQQWACDDGYLDVMVNHSVGHLLLRCMGSLQTAYIVSVLHAGSTAVGLGQAGHPVQGDGSLCAAQGTVSWKRLTGRRLAAQSFIRPQVPPCAGQGSVTVSIWDCPPPQAVQGNRTLQSDVCNTGDEVPHGGRPVVLGCPGTQQREISVYAEVLL